MRLRLISALRWQELDRGGLRQAVDQGQEGPAAARPLDQGTDAEGAGQREAAQAPSTQEVRRQGPGGPWGQGAEMAKDAIGGSVQLHWPGFFEGTPTESSSTHNVHHEILRC